MAWAASAPAGASSARLPAPDDSARTHSAISSASDTAAGPPSRIVRTKADLDNPVTFSSQDSLVLIRRDSAFLYGDAKVGYGKMGLTAALIELDLANDNVFAVGVADTAGEVQGKPQFKDGDDQYESATMRYNFNTQKGYITDVVTQQGEGFISGGTTKRNKEGDFYMKNVRYTTCDDHECPHFYLQLTKAKMKPGKNVVTGPAYMVLAGLPLPIAVPFGYFPFSKKYASGIIVPTFGDDYKRGFYLRDGGYYFAINDNIDMALTGEVYTKGSWGLRAQSAYVKRYRYQGSFDVSYLKTVLGDKGSPDYSKQTNFQILWSHTQDQRANPNMSLSASVNFTTSGYSRNDLGSYYSDAFTENTKSSTVNMSYRFPNSKWSLSTTMNIAQRTQDSTLAVSFPNVTVTMAQTAPFKRKRAVGGERWYEKIRISYSGMLQNSLTAKQNVFFKKNLIKDWRNAMKHSVPISATFNLFSYINITPSLSVTDRMYTSKVRRQWDPNASVEVCDTAYGFYNVYDFSGSISLDTKIYGFWQPRGALGRKIKMIRHVFTPTVSFSGAPDFGSSFFGYYGRYQKPGPDGTMVTQDYSYFPNALYGVPGRGRSGIISVNLANNLEMKVNTDDSIGEKKISLIENLAFSQSYNLAADSLKWSNIQANLNLRLFKGFNLNLGSTWDVYTYALNEAGQPVRVDKLCWSRGRLPRLSSTGTSFSYTINNNTFRRGKDKDKDKSASSDKSDMSDFTDESGRSAPREEKEDLTLGPDGYAAWSVPWNLSFNYSFSYGYGAFDYEKMHYKGRITQNLSLSGNIQPTAGWNLGFSASYNFDTHRLAYMNCNVTRDMHCFTLSASFVPVGPYKSYNFHIAVKSALLSDLKYDKRSSYSNGVTWY